MPTNRGRYRDDEDDDDHPRRRRRRDDDDRPFRHPRRKSSGSAGKIVAIVLGCLGVVVVVVLVVVLLTGTLSGSNISYEQYNSVGPTDTIDGLEKKFGRATKFERGEWDKVEIGSKNLRAGGGSSTLAGYNHWARDVTAWYRWRKGQEEVYVVEGADLNGRRGLVLKVYFNPKAAEDAIRNPNGPQSDTPWLKLDQLGTGGGVRFGGR